jgi:thiamine pyrophosphate-dependent acetolactate synthase large subunit-like protein
MEEAALPIFEGARFKNPDFALFAQACGGTGFRVTDPASLQEIVSKALTTAGPVIVDVTVNPAELPSLPHIDPAQVVKFGVGMVREFLGR